ncbi:MAG: hypothetical protein GF315_07145 [candidate division Zixibacteria bacterium]|nr:hypothetical protein [candidate division Zixibacteria bacterium]
MDSENLNKLEEKVKAIVDVVSELRTERNELRAQVRTLNEQLEAEREKNRILNIDLKNSQTEKERETKKFLERESLAKAKIEAIVDKLSIIES